MKRFVELFVLMAVVVLVIVGLVGTASAGAVSPVARIRLDASLKQRHGSGVSAPILKVATTFSTDTPGASLFTVQRATLYFPDQGADGRLFPSCSARQIARFHGNIRRCPSGSKIGSGTVKAQVLGLGITATARVSLFNSRRGKSLTFNIQASVPAAINRSFDAPITHVRGGRYPEKLTLAVPRSLQEILSGVFVAVQEFDVTINGAVRVRGVQQPYLAARSCPKRPMRGVFDFKDWSTGQTATVTTDAELHCKAG